MNTPQCQHVESGQCQPCMYPTAVNRAPVVPMRFASRRGRDNRHDRVPRLLVQLIRLNRSERARSHQLYYPVMTSHKKTGAPIKLPMEKLALGVV